MPETQVTQTVQTVDNSKTQPQTPASQTNQQHDDIVKRASQVQIAPKASQEKSEEATFDYSKLSTIKTPEEAKAWAEEAYKSMQRGYNQKYQDIATIKKMYETKLAEEGKWTPEKVQSLLADNNFVQAAQSVLGVQGNTSEESYLSESDKKRILDADTKAQQALEYQAQLYREKEHEVLKGKYPNYDANVVDGIRKDLLAGKVNATGEYIWKAYDYENAVRRGYELGKQDASAKTTEKVNASSFDGGFNITNNSEPLKKEERESDQSYFKRLFAFNLQKSQGVQQTRK